MGAATSQGQHGHSSGAATPTRGRFAVGLHIGHDRGAALVRDGEVVGHIAQERLDRRKYSVGSAIPYEALDALLRYFQLTMKQIDVVGITFDNANIALFAQEIAEELRFHYRVPAIEVLGVQHHLAHALGAYATSGFDECLILVADGAGDLIGNSAEAETLFRASGASVEMLERRVQSFTFDTFDTPQRYNARLMPSEYRDLTVSLGRKYEQITHLIGLGWEQHGKTMALAAYGQPLFEIPQLEVSGLQFDLTAIDVLDRIEEIRSRRGVSMREFLRDERANIARTIQDFTERALCRVIEAIHRRYGTSALCLSGGVFLNCVANHELAKLRLFHPIHILPACGDDGQAIGAAIEAYRAAHGSFTRHSAQFPYLGLSYDDQTVEAAITSSGLPSSRLPDQDLASFLADRIVAGAVVGIVRGRTEIGPRALCHRSILLDPRRSDGKDFLNERVKFREHFRPYAPVVTAETQYQYFDLASSSPYMLYACDVRPEYRALLPAITHVDGTARVQAIDAAADPFAHRLLSEFAKRTGFPILLNTSFNLAGEPIVEAPKDAIQTFVNTAIDVLVIENYVVQKT